MRQTNRKTVRLIMSQELYDAIKAQANEEYRSVPKHILQIVKTQLGLLGQF